MSGLYQKNQAFKNEWNLRSVLKKIVFSTVVNFINVKNFNVKVFETPFH